MWGEAIQEIDKETEEVIWEWNSYDHLDVNIDILNEKFEESLKFSLEPYVCDSQRYKLINRCRERKLYNVDWASFIFFNWMNRTNNYS